MKKLVISFNIYQNNKYSQKNSFTIPCYVLSYILYLNYTRILYSKPTDSTSVSASSERTDDEIKALTQDIASYQVHVNFWLTELLL